MLKGPKGFGKTWLLHLVQEFFDKNWELNTKLDTAEIMKDKIFVAANFRRYRVISVDFARLSGDTFEKARSAFGAPLGMTGAEYFHKLTESERNPFILLVDNLDFPLFHGYLNGFQDEVIEFVGGFLDAMGQRDLIMRCLITSALSLFVKDVISNLPPSILTVDIYDGWLGQYLGFTVEAVRMIKERCSEYIDASVTYSGLQRRFGGYFSGAPNQMELMHPLGIIPVCRVMDSNMDVRIIAKVTAFKDSMPLLVALFRKMEICYEHLLRLIHSTDHMDIQRDCDHGSTSTSKYSFIDYVLVLHDLGLMTRRTNQDTFSIVNADAMMTLIQISNTFMIERIDLRNQELKDAELEELLNHE